MKTTHMTTLMTALAGCLLAAADAAAAAAEAVSPAFVIDLHQQHGVTVRGRVLEAAGSQPLASVRVNLAGTHAVTAADGGFVFMNLALTAGNELTVANAPGYGDHAEDVVPEPGASEVVVPDILLKPSGFTVTELRGGGGYFIEGVPYEHTFTALVNWGGKAPGSVEFLVNGSLAATVPTGRGLAEAALDMSAPGFSAANASNVVQAVAVTAQGERTAPLAQEVNIVTLPGILHAPLAAKSFVTSKGNDPGISFKLKFPEDLVPAEEERDMALLGRLGLHLKATGGMQVKFNSGEWNVYAGAIRDKKWGKEAASGSLLSPYLKPKFLVGERELGFEAKGTLEGRLSWKEPFHLDKLGIALGLSYEAEILTVRLSDFLPGGQWIRLLDRAQAVGFDPNSIQRVKLVASCEVESGIAALLQDVPLAFEGGTLTVALGLKAAYEPKFLIVKAKVHVGGTVTSIFDLAPELGFKSLNAKAAGTVSIEALFFKPYNNTFVLLDETWPKAPGAMAAPGFVPAGFGAGGGGWVVLPAVSPGPGLIDRKHLLAGPEAFVAGAAPRPLKAAFGPAPAAADGGALEAFRRMDALAQADLPLVANVFPESEPALAAWNDELMLLYVGDNGAPETLRCTDIRWTRWDGGQWSEPAAILADTRGEFAPQVAFDGNGDAIAAWVRVADEAFDGEDLSDMTPELEIVWARWSRAAGTWGAPQPLTDNAVTDHAPLLCGPAEDGSVLAVWTRNAASLLMGTAADPDQVLGARWDPAAQAWSAEQTLVPAVSRRLSHTLACATNGCAVYGWTADLDGDLATGADQEAFACLRQGGAWGAAQRLTDNAVADDALQMAVGPDGVPSAVWRQDGALVMRRGLAGETRPVRAGSETAGFGGFALAGSPAGHLALVWQEMAESDSDAHYRVYDPASDTWGRDARLCADTALERDFAPVWDGAGNLVVAYNKVDIQTVAKTVELEAGGTVEIENMPEPGQVDLYVTKRALVRDLAIPEDGFTADGADYLPGEAVTLRAVLRNLGDVAVTNAAVAFYDGDPAAGGALISNVVFGGWFEAAAAGTAEALWVVPEPGAAHLLHAVASHGTPEPEFDAANNTRTLAVGGTDLLVAVLSHRARADGALRVYAQVRNAGGPAAGESVLAIRRSDAGGAAQGPALATAAVPAIAPGRLAQVALDLPAGTQAFDDEFYQLFVNETGAVDEVETGNNAAVFSVHVVLDSDGDGMPDSWERQYGLDPHTPDPPGQDSDGDGVPDVREYQLGLDPHNPDSDGDGMSDGDELAAGTDPLSATDVFRIVSADGAATRAMRVQWNAKAGKTYRVQCAPALAGPWQSAPAGGGAEGASLRTADADGVLAYIDTDTEPPARFYRVRIVPEDEEPEVPPAPEGMALVPGGTNSGTVPGSGASYSLTVEPFFMDINAVTKAKWDEVRAWALANGYGFGNAGSGKAADHPVHTVNWDDCVKWCNARSEKEGLAPCYRVSGAVYRTGSYGDSEVVSCDFAADGYRLPTATEWEYAARGGLSGMRFPWGDTITHSQANYCSSASDVYDTSPTRGYHPEYATGAEPYTSPAGAFPANGYGLHDMAGNVWQWCWDLSSNGNRRIRGGGWISNANAVRCRSDIYTSHPTTANIYRGFRALRPAILQ